LPYKFDVKAFASITNDALREHIERVGVVLYPAHVALNVGDMDR
jgi:hypothetical protein